MILTSIFNIFLLILGRYVAYYAFLWCIHLPKTIIIAIAPLFSYTGIGIHSRNHPWKKLLYRQIWFLFFWTSKISKKNLLSLQISFHFHFHHDSEYFYVSCFCVVRCVPFTTFSYFLWSARKSILFTNRSYIIGHASINPKLFQ